MQRRGRSRRGPRIGCVRRTLAPVEGDRLFLSHARKTRTFADVSPLLRANECVAAARRQGQVEGHDETPRAQIVIGERIESEQHAGAFDRRVERVIRAIEIEGRD